ncbi:unnamed protein product [Moneuplotes crassus]|uniref:Calpain catalytic domain-containing protein n=1 Tax=Euplotes crassus TaxID=5936 RepID=A0AAD2DAY1_EUPCR|nr:unnamed protein product [Moneuplotes crassus]
MENFESKEETKGVEFDSRGTVDGDFPPQPSSLYSITNTKLSKLELEVWKSYVWKRPHEIFDGPFHLFSEGIDPCDIKQGILGNCYFLSALSALAEFPAEIKKIFQDKEVSKNGIYKINFKLGGENRTVLIDDYIPFDPKKNKPAFSQSKGNELWVMLLEKAWAKVNGNYEKSIKGFVSEAFRALTGAPVVFFKHLYIQDIWDEIYEADKVDYIICGSSGEDNLHKYEEMGLISEHAYSVIEAREIETPKGKERLLKMRNPWGHKEWLGKWSDNDESWTDELRETLGCQEKNDGVFFMCVEDYLSYFRTTVICKGHENFVSHSIKCKHNTGDYNLIKITIENEGKIFFTVSQLNQRWARRYKEYEPSFVRMLLARIVSKDEDEEDDFPLEYTDGKCWKDEDTTIELNLRPGKYLAYIEIDWFDDTQYNTYLFRSYSQIAPIIEEINPKKYPNFLKDTLKSCAINSTALKSFQEKGEPDIFRAFSITASKCEYGFLYYENNSSGTILREIMKFSKLENLSLMPPYEGDSVEVKVYPGDKQIILFNRNDRACSCESIYHTTLVKPLSDTLERITEKGKKHQIEYNDEKYEVYYYVYKDGSGFCWYFVNNSNQLETCLPYAFEGTFYFKLENLEIDDDAHRDKQEWKVRLMPGETSSMKLLVKDITKSWGYKYSYSFKTKEIIKKNEKLREILLKNGTKRQITYRNTKMDVYNYVYFSKDRYLWYYENLTNLKFKGIYRFQLTNLQIDKDQDASSEDTEDQWTVILIPGQTCLRTLSRIDSKLECQFKVASSHCFSEKTY